jgi:biopolymer transport protein ExbD
MRLERRNKVSTDFNMSSMTDLVFLLLIFFMLTSNFVSPSGLPIELPTSSKVPPLVPVKTHVTVTKDLRYFVNEKEVSLQNMEYELKVLMKGEENLVVLNIDRTVPTENFVKVATIANAIGAKVSIAVSPELK